MLWWVLLCDYCSSFFYLPKTSELGRAINAHIIVIAYYSNHFLVFRVCSVAELSSAFIILPPLRELQLSTPTLSSSFFRVTSHEHGACPPRLYTVVYFFMHVSQKVEIRVPFSSNGSFRRVPLSLPLTTTVSVEETLMDFGYTYAPNLIHQGASIITEISFAHDEKNSTSSKQ
jgi:hypothetical protein